ncbi:MAG: DoxX family protein [Halodesulfurarchaeum sp.]
MQSQSPEINRFESTLGGVTVSGRAHSLSAWFVLALRLTMGVAFLWTGIEKVLSGSFSAAGYLQYATVENGSPLADLFVWMATTEPVLAAINIAIPFGEVAIGLGLIVGFLTRLAAFFGAMMMFFFWMGNWAIAHGVINSDFAYMLVFLSVAAFGAGRILGLDAVVEQMDVGGEPLISRYPVLAYVLG